MQLTSKDGTLHMNTGVFSVCGLIKMESDM